MTVLRTMYDSDRAADIPGTASMVAGYVDGVHPWTPADWARFHPSATRVRIARSYLTADAHVLDSEVGLASVGQTVTWVAQQHHAGRFPGVYCNLSRWSGLIESLRLSQVAMPWFWVAHWVGSPPLVLPSGSLGMQYADPALSGGHYDLSAMAPYLPGVDPRPAPVTIQGKGDTVELTSKVRDRVAVAATSTVEEALSTVLGGIVGKREAGALYLLVSQMLGMVESMRADLDTLMDHAGLEVTARAEMIEPTFEQAPAPVTSLAAAPDDVEVDQ